MLEQTQGHCSDIFVTYYTCLSVSFVVLVLVFSPTKFHQIVTGPKSEKSVQQQSVKIVQN